MKAGIILRITSHRPWPLPSRFWIMRQTWHELLFAHWPMPPEIVRPTLPAGLTLDIFDGQAWVGVVPFHMSGVRLRGCPPVVAARFAEVNVRTYVTASSKRGVYFYSLDADSRIAVWLARRAFALPYYQARFNVRRTGEGMSYTTTRTHRYAPSGELRVRYRPTGLVYQSQPGTLEHWLTERYCLYAASKRGLLRGDIHHRQWTLQRAEAEIERETLSRAAGLTVPNHPPLLHYAERLDVLIWPEVLVRET
jgi:uncharacterized protein YqjF (DUF2071 family)